MSTSSTKNKKETDQLGLKSKLTFGKYRGYRIEDVLEVDPSYLVWAVNNVHWFRLKPNVYELAIDGLYKERTREYLNDLDWGGDVYDFMG